MRNLLFPVAFGGGRTARVALGLVALVAASLALPSVVWAHAEYDRSNPPADTAVPEAPERLDVWFTQDLFRREGENALEVTNEAGERVDLDDLVIDDADRTHASVGLPVDLPAGTYTVYWRTLSATDGDTDEGTFTFTIDPNATPVPTETVEATATEPPTSTPTPDGASPTSEATPSGEGGEAGEDDEAEDEGTPMPWWVLIAALGILGAGAAGAWAIRMEEPAP